MGVKLGHSHWGGNGGWVCLRIGCWEYLDLRGTRWQGSGENYIMWSLIDLYSSPNIVWVINLRRMGWARHVVCVGERRGVYRGLVGRPEGKRPHGRPRCRWEDNIKMNLQEVGCGGMDFIKLANDRDSWRALVTVIEPSGSIKCREFLD